ncbi:MAG: spore germination protein [Clostridia bacterium]|nr:spore germination protein [Clostridia bacterium]
MEESAKVRRLEDRLKVSQREGIIKRLVLKPSLEENIKLLKAVAGPSPDVVFRRLTVGEGRVKVAVFHIENLSDSLLVEKLIRMLGLGTRLSRMGPVTEQELFSQLKEQWLQSSEVCETDTIDEVWNALVEGNSVVVFHGIARALACSTQGYDKRAVDEPQSETVIRGPRDGFIESISTNISLVRRRLKTPNLWIENFTLGRLSRTRVVMLYIKGLASEELVQEVRQRVNRIKIDAVLESGYVEEFIEDNPFSIFPLVFRTERPDRVAACLLEGKVAVMTDGTPFVLVVPMDFPMLLQAPDDYYEKVPVGSFLRLLRLVAFIGSIILPGTYVAVVRFHPELIPTNLLLRITGAKEGVPFPIVFEVFMMELLFELLREAGIRLPRVIGPAVSIVGALVLGEAAIRAGLVSPPVVIIVALTAIASFTVPTFSFGIAARLVRFIFILLGGALGLFGIQFGLLFMIILLASLRSFGYPFLAPLAPLIVSDLKDIFSRMFRWSFIRRPKLTGAREPVRQPQGQMPGPGREKEEKEKNLQGAKDKWSGKR